MKPSRNYIAINSLLLLALLFMGAIAYAAEAAGTVTHLSGPLMAKKADGTVNFLAQKSAVEQGDILISGDGTYARIKFADNSEITLRPNSQLKIDSFSYDEAMPEQDSAIFSLIKGGLRAVTGLLGKRNKERVGVNTPTATIGIRGTIFIADYVPANEQAFAHADARAPGLYVQVLDGMIYLRNDAGSEDFAAGQFGYTPDMQTLPVVLPANPGIQFALPPAFSSSIGPQGGQQEGDEPSDLACEVG